MFNFREKNDVASLQVFAAPGIRNEVDALGCATREDDFIGALRVDELRRARLPIASAFS